MGEILGGKNKKQKHSFFASCSIIILMDVILFISPYCILEFFFFFCLAKIKFLVYEMIKSYYKFYFCNKLDFWLNLRNKTASE